MKLECWITLNGETGCIRCGGARTGSTPVALEAPRTCFFCKKEITDEWPKDTPGAVALGGREALAEPEKVVFAVVRYFEGQPETCCVHATRPGAVDCRKIRADNRARVRGLSEAFVDGNDLHASHHEWFRIEPQPVHDGPCAEGDGR